MSWEDRYYTSWSEIDTARQCLRKHHLRYKRDLVDRVTPPALDRGTRWHTLLEELYKTGDPEAPVQQLRTWTDEQDGDPNELELLTWMLDGYYDKWGLGDPQFSDGAVAVELEFEVELPQIGAGPLVLKGVVDLLVEIWGKLWVVDHKSGKTKPKDRSLEMADQWTLYVWAMQQEGYDVFGSIHSYAKTERLKRDMSLEERFARKPIHRTDREVEAVAREAAIQAWQARIDNGAPRSPGDHCSYRCGYLDVCIADRRYGEGMAENILQIKHQPKEQQ